MRRTHIGVTAIAAAAITLSGCAIDTSVSPVASHPDRVCLVQNDDVLMNGFHAELARQIEAHGIQVDSVDGTIPQNCHYVVKYTAKWKWDVAMYLQYAQIDVYHDKDLAGRAIYDARSGGLNMNKFGPTAEKIKPLVVELFG